MLVLSRKIDESFSIGDSIVITILAVEGENVKIGITAPREMTILRQEVLKAIQEQKKIQELMANEPEPMATEHFEQLRKLLASEGDHEANDKEKGGDQTS